MGSNSVDSTKESAGEYFFQPFMIACAKAWLVLNVAPSRSRLFAIGSRKLGTRPNSEFGTHVLMKFSFKNAMI